MILQTYETCMTELEFQYSRDINDIKMSSLSQTSYILLLPEVALEKIFSFLSYDEIAKNRIVCKRFNDVGSKLLSRGFIQLEKRHSTIYKRVKSALPRRESERKTHPLSKHSDILQAVETRMSMLNMTYTKFIDHKLICFLPGKVLDELKSILDLVDSNNTPPRTHLLLQELRDLSSMAMEHFEEHILPRCKEQLERRTGPPEKILKELEIVAGSITPYKNFRDIISTNGTSTSKPGPRIFPLPLAISNEIYKVKKVAKSHKQHIGYLTLSTQKLCLKLRRTTSKLRTQSAKIRQQERQIREQNSKILEQEASLNDIKKHIDEWDQKYKDLTAELVRARDEMLLKTSTTTNSVTNASSSTTTMMNTNNVVNTLNFSSQTTGLSLMSNIKPRVAHILPKSYLKLDCERKRKSTLNAELPSKRSRSPTTVDNREISKSDATQKNSLNISDLVNFEKRDCTTEDNGNSLTRAVVDTTKSLVSCFSGLSNNAPNSVKPRKRKMTEDIDLK